MQTEIHGIEFTTQFGGRPFSRAMAQSAGITESQLRAGLRHGMVRTLMRGVYVEANAPDSLTLRREAVRTALAGSDGAIICGPTAAWLYGVGSQSPSVGPTRARSARSYQPHDLINQSGFQVTTPVRTSIDLALQLSTPDAVAAWDFLFGRYRVGRGAILAELSRFTRRDDHERITRCLALVDDRANCRAESLIRIAWVAGTLPTPIPGLVVRHESQRIRLALGLTEQQFGVVISRADQAADLAMLRRLGWGIVEVGARQVEAARPETLSRMLIGEYHRTLLSRVAPVSA